MKFYLLVVWNDVEPEILGPFASEESRLAAARDIRREDPDKDHGVYRLEAEGNVVVKEFTGGVLGDGKIQPGDEVYWHDPDNGIASGYGTVIDTHSDFVTLRMHSGSEVEALCHELDLFVEPEEETSESHETGEMAVCVRCTRPIPSIPKDASKDDCLCGACRESDEDKAREAREAKEENMTSEELREYYGHWEQHPDFPVRDWAFEAQNDDTRLGYWEWVAAQRHNA